VQLPRKTGLALALMLFLSVQAFASEVLVAAASDLSGAIKEISAAFEKNTGHSVKLTLGSSGNFHAQILNGAPFDVFLSADLRVPQNSPLPIEQVGMKALLDPRVKRIAIANPEHAPYGRAAVEAMKKAGVYESAKSKFVLGENISQAAQFAQSGSADVGIVALSLALSESMKAQGRYWDIPMSSYPRMEQGAVILKQAGKAGHRDAARAFMDALRSEPGQAVLRRYGFLAK
jgi:molybdate transport system substrate-binding protein